MLNIVRSIHLHYVLDRLVCREKSLGTTALHNTDHITHATSPKPTDKECVNYQHLISYS